MNDDQEGGGSGADGGMLQYWILGIISHINSSACWSDIRNYFPGILVSVEEDKERYEKIIGEVG